MLLFQNNYVPWMDKCTENVEFHYNVNQLAAIQTLLAHRQMPVFQAVHVHKTLCLMKYRTNMFH